MIDCSQCGATTLPYPHPDSRVCPACYDANVASYSGHLAELVHDHRFAVQGVMASDDSFNWAYTVGLTDHGLPELVMMALPMGFLGQTLNRLGDAAIDGTTQLVAGPSPLFLDPPFWLVDVPDPTSGRYPLTMAATSTLGKVRAMQVVWPDSEGRYPWAPDWFDGEDRGDLGGKDPQPLLGLPPADDRREDR